jgi:double-stranded uracil-DNA glycosylase
VKSLKSCFPPVVDERSRLLLLGSLPGEQSLAQGRYYANPRNQFWRLMERVLDAELVPLAYEARLQTLLDAGIGLWDTVGSATRTGSLDGQIRDPSANDLAGLAASLPALRAVGFNGGKSAALGMKQLAGEPRLALLALPSSSPAFTLPFEAKAEQWMRLKAFL